ncbi:nuclear transport factor 2 family protein [uncultured Sneathiella sp.]|jgi:hypothetical protein|uniref:nuclear transport factor 2 family protein n=1 Tax=uncultured Sneathiella sp. TaxID=879315 RepID=UPI00259545E3|nr:nuclear transport factor 2 family protein [uncultured Sneathiella sp.]
MTAANTNQAVLDAYIRYFETLKPDTVDDLDKLACEELYFEDPFNQLTNRRDVKRLFRQMFVDMDDPAFKISASFWSENGQSAILKWRFAGNAQKIGRLDFEGVSEIHFDENGVIDSHVDYWDAASRFYEKIPLIGAVLRVIRRKLRLS